jgi:hypothetical protein
MVPRLTPVEDQTDIPTDRAGLPTVVKAVPVHEAVKLIAGISVLALKYCCITLGFVLNLTDVVLASAT